ncbi:hypothetical protein BD779DRAFT_1479631 [Infundibulicybe gibba]|nr:hypothetical protein BD779DRAFT_1479631 [Infundibulicybe gibba]
MSAAELNLRDALEEWREAGTLERYGWTHLNDLGPTLIMPLGILNSIIDSETQWDGVDRYGDEIVALISRICPRPSVQTPLTTPMPPRQSSSTHGLNTKPDPTSSVSTELGPTVPAEEKTDVVHVVELDMIVSDVAITHHEFTKYLYDPDRYIACLDKFFSVPYHQSCLRWVAAIGPDRSPLELHAHSFDLLIIWLIASIFVMGFSSYD